MAERSWTNTLALTALLLISGGGTAGFTQSASGSLSGRLTDLDSKPLSGVTVTVRNEDTGAEAQSITSASGTYRFKELGSGTYILEAESPGLGWGRVDGIEVDAGHESRVQSALEFEPLQTKSDLLETHDIGAQPAKLNSEAVGVQPEELSSAELGILVGKHVSLEPDAAPVNVALEAEQLEALPVSAGEIQKPLPRQSRPAVSAKAEASETQLRSSETFEAEVRGGAVRPGSGIEGNRGDGAGAAGLEGLPGSVAGEHGAAMIEFAVHAALATIQYVAPVPEPALASDGTANTGAAANADTVAVGQLQALPLTGRNWQNFLMDTPDTATQMESEGEGLRGGVQTGSVSVEGSSTRLAFGGAGVGRMNGRGASLLGPGASEEAIREVQAAGGNVDVSAGRAGGERLNIETQRGSHGLHGQGSLLSRQNLWGAQNPFTQWTKETSPATLSAVPNFTPESYTPGDHELTWGFGAGGEMRRNKRFWFAALDSYRRNDPGVSMVKHPDSFFAQPSNDQMQVLSARLGLSSANPVAAGVAAYSNMLETLDGLLGPAARTAAQWTGFGRLDWAAAERHHFTLEGTGANWDSPGGGMTRASEAYGNHSYGSNYANEEWIQARLQSFITANLLAVAQGSVGREMMTAPHENPSAYEQTLNINDWGQLPQMIVDSRYGFTIGNPSRFGPGDYPDEHLYHAQEQVDWVHGGIMVKAGFDVGHNTDETSLLRNETGTYYYASVENFASDALAFANFGLNGQLNPTDQHNCDQTGKVWRDSAGTLHGLGYLPCYSYYSQTMGPTNWWLSTNDWASYVTAQWQPQKRLALSMAMRWEREQLPPPMAMLNNPDLPLTERLPSLGNDWGPRASLAWGTGEDRWPVLRLGYGMYFGRTENATLENALTQTGSLKGDLNFFMRPTDNLNAGGAPPFPYVLAGEPASVVKPGAVEFAPDFRNGEVHQAVASVEESLPQHIHLEASAEASLGRRLPVTLD
ncbi:MAG: carboxypeptidase-like regulatory domain-containing protein, partial [Terracidiphilus sp.]